MKAAGCAPTRRVAKMQRCYFSGVSSQKDCHCVQDTWKKNDAGKKKKKKQATNTHECLRHTIHCCCVPITICLRLNSSAEFCSASVAETLNKAFYRWQYFTRHAFLLITLSVTQSSHTQNKPAPGINHSCNTPCCKVLATCKSYRGTESPRLRADEAKQNKFCLAYFFYLFFIFWKNVQRHLICLPLQLAGDISTCFKSPVHGY